MILFYVDSKEDDLELSGLITCQVDASITIDILSGYHDDATKTLLLSSTCIDFNDFGVIEATDPTEEPDQLDNEPDEPDEPYIPDFYDDFDCD